jgi:hypothetical protein
MLHGAIHRLAEKISLTPQRRRKRPTFWEYSSEICLKLLKIPRSYQSPKFTTVVPQFEAAVGVLSTMQNMASEIEIIKPPRGHIGPFLRERVSSAFKSA